MSDLGQRLFCRVTATNPYGSAIAYSNVVGPVMATAPASDVILLLHADGANNSTVFTDSSPYNHVVTANGNARIVTAQSKFGGASAYSDGNDWLSLNGGAEFSYGTGDFTIDFQFRATNAALICVMFSNATANFQGPLIYINNGVALYYAASQPQITGTTVLSNNTWYHIAVTRSSSVTRLFVNGIEQGSYADGNNYIVGADHPIIMSQGGANGAECWMDEVRIIRGSAAWTSNFTPPTTAYGAAEPIKDRAGSTLLDRFGATINARV